MKKRNNSKLENAFRKVKFKMFGILLILDFILISPYLSKLELLIDNSNIALMMLLYLVLLLISTEIVLFIIDKYNQKQIPRTLCITVEVLLNLVIIGLGLIIFGRISHLYFNYSANLELKNYLIVIISMVFGMKKLIKNKKKSINLLEEYVDIYQKLLN